MEKKPDRRSKQKYPALKKDYNLKMRQDYMDLDYVDGCYDHTGTQVIRPLNHEEKAWLNQFYTETVNANINKDKKSKELSKELTKLKSVYRKIEDDTNLSELEQKIVKATKKLEDHRKKLGNLYYKKSDESGIYDENNSRNRCILNRHRGQVDALDEGLHEKYGNPQDPFDSMLKREQREYEEMEEEKLYVEELIDATDE